MHPRSHSIACCPTVAHNLHCTYISPWKSGSCNHISTPYHQWMLPILLFAYERRKPPTASSTWGSCQLQRSCNGCWPTCRIWFYWGCNPLAYAQKGMAVNEFRAPRWQSIYTTSANTETVGDAVLEQRGLPRNGYNRALGFCVLATPPPPAPSPPSSTQKLSQKN
jgi:hypothetical protein